MIIQSAKLYAVLTVAAIVCTPLWISSIINHREAEAQSSITISGRVTTAINTSVANAKVYLEAPDTASTLSPWQTTATTDAFGLWSKSLPAGYTYKVDTSKFGYQRDRHPVSISTTTGDVNLIINPQTTRVINLLVAPEEEFRSDFPSTWESVAWSKITQKEWVYRQNWNVQFDDVAYSDDWTSVFSSSCGTLVSDAMSDTGWSANQFQGADVLVAITYQTMSGGTFGCIDEIPIGPGEHPATINQDGVGVSVSDTVTHELFHAYGFEHHSSNWYCTMGNWREYNTAQPAYDQDMALDGTSSHRNWY